MGQIKLVAFLVAIFLFFSATLVIYIKPARTLQVKDQPLSTILSPIKNWLVTGKIPLQSKVINTLELDDYLFQNYSRSDQDVSLYIGYYFSTGKVGAAHDPLVCLPGQGWFIKKRGKGYLNLDNSEGLTISYATMVVERSGEQELFLYWFQAYDKAVPGTFSQKLVSLANTIQGLGQDNAFVRLSCSMRDRTEQQCMQVLESFTRDFYPEFLKYVRDDK